MTDKTLRTCFRIGLFVSTAVIAVLAFYPVGEIPLTGHDKPNHVLAFAVLAWLANGGFPGSTRVMAKWVLLLLAYGLFIEVVQYHLPYREFSWLDFGADAVGILLYIGSAGVWRETSSGASL